MTESQKKRKAETNSAWYKRHKDRLRTVRAEWWKNHPDKRAEYQKKYHHAHKDICHQRCAEWRAKNPNYSKQYRRINGNRVRGYENAWKKANRDKVRATERRHSLKQPNRKLQTNISRRIRRALNGSVKHFRTLEYVGCSADELRTHLQSMFTPDMSWENYGSVWHVDHIIPCLKFDLRKPEHQKRCFHFSNLQPLLALENIRKRAKCDVPQLRLI